VIRRRCAQTGGSRPARAVRSDSGAASILVLGAVLACSLVCALWLSGAQAGIARQHAETAADLAAIAAAREGASSPVPACEVAAATAARNGAHLSACRVSGDSVEVTVTVSATQLGRPAQARARAGPEAAPQ
jgi:secretion/DNA translocation related TadE-like protein